MGNRENKWLVYVFFIIYENRRYMKRTFEEAIANRRSYYHIGSDSPVADEEIVRIIHEAVKHVPSAYNSQSTRIVLLLGDEHKKLWEIVKNILKMMFIKISF